MKGPGGWLWKDDGVREKTDDDEKRNVKKGWVVKRKKRRRVESEGRWQRQGKEVVM